MLLLTTEIARAHTHGFCKAVVAAHGSKGVVASALSISYLGKKAAIKGSTLLPLETGNTVFPMFLSTKALEKCA